MRACAKGHLYQDELLHCPTCIAEKNDQAIRDVQAMFLATAVAGGYALRVAKKSPRHVLMFKSDTRIFCGTNLDAKPQIEYTTYSTETLAKVCPGCRVAIASAVEDLTQ